MVRLFLPLTCHRPVSPGLHEEAAGMHRADQLGLPRERGSRADERHLAANDVQQLRQLVDAGAAQAPADLGDPGVVLQLVEAAPPSGGRLILG